MQKKDRRDQLTPAQEGRRLEIERLVRERTYRGLMDALGLPNTSYLSDFVHWGIIPGNREIADKMGIPRAPSKGAKRYQALSEKARAAGWESWSAFCTAVLNGDVKVPSVAVAAYMKPGKYDVVFGNIRLLDVSCTAENYGVTGARDDEKDSAGGW